MKLIKTIGTIGIGNYCGQYFLEIQGEKIGPFPALVEAEKRAREWSGRTEKIREERSPGLEKRS